ncbi:Glycylpeptide N-tetradecanoyltransferase 1 [Camelus dromedarius]|uniref:Glycylpeptide N-tetradecanoyltransferase n=1 Tax=Camelus dromedarius TaxID=9838 RepID=A0A5N4D448_CAMDR|nr:Glycylpeptide N-tetradecanoyltransferase 1 [Camelus dromedarius]
MEKKDIPVVHQLLTRYLKQFHLTPVMSQEEVEHWFYPQENIIDTFVVENANGEEGEAAFICLHLSLFLPTTAQKGFDVFNALDLMENKTFLEKLKFGIGDGNLQYYLYNWKCPSMGAEKVGLVLQ